MSRESELDTKIQSLITKIVRRESTNEDMHEYHHLCSIRTRLMNPFPEIRNYKIV